MVDKYKITTASITQDPLSALTCFCFCPYTCVWIFSTNETKPTCHENNVNCCFSHSVHLCGNMRMWASPSAFERLLWVLSAAVGCICGFEVKPCHSAAPRHRGLVKVKLVICLWRQRRSSEQTFTYAHAHTHAPTHTARQTAQTLYNHKPWHGTCPTEISLWREKIRSSRDESGGRREDMKAETVGNVMRVRERWTG